MVKPPKPVTTRPPGVPLPPEEVEETTRPGSQNSGHVLTQALSTWPVKYKVAQSLARGSEPPPTQVDDEIFHEDVLLHEQQAPQRGLLEGVYRSLRRLRELPGRISSLKGGRNGQ